MNYALKINALVNELWSDQPEHCHQHISLQNLNQVDRFLETLSLNQYHQIIEICSQKALFVVLQKSHVVIKKHADHKAQLLKESNSFFLNWVLPQFPFNLKRSYDGNCLEPYFEGLIGKVIGKVLKQISKSNTQIDWDLVSEYLTSIGEKNAFYQILMVLGYFCEIESMSEQFQEFDSVREILKNFEYEIIPKVMQIVIRNISICKETLQLVQLETMSKQLSLTQDLPNMKTTMNQQNYKKTIQVHENFNQSKIKYLKMNFEILRKVVEFNYHVEFKDAEGNGCNGVGMSVEEERLRWGGFPEYMIRLFLESGLIKSLYEVAQILIGFKSSGKDVEVGFGEIVLDLINKIIRTQTQELDTHLKHRFMNEVLNGQLFLMKKLLEQNTKRETLVIKVIRGSIKLLRNLSLKEILITNQGQQWVLMVLRLIQKVFTNDKIIDIESYLVYKALSFTKQIVYQTALYEIPLINEPISRDVFMLGLKIQEIFVINFIASSKFLEKNKYYNIEDLQTKRDRLFHNLKTLSQIHLPQFNNLIQSVLSNLNSVQSAVNYLILMSYFISTESLNCSSYVYQCLNADVIAFKKLAIGNGVVLTQELAKSKNLQKYGQFQDAVLIFVDKLLSMYFDHDIPIDIIFSVTDTLLPIDQITTQLISSKPKLITFLFLQILQIIHIKTEKQPISCESNIFPYYFEAFIKHLTHLTNENGLISSYEIISIQREIVHHFIELKTYLRRNFKFLERKYLSEISVLLNHEPEKSSQKGQKHEDNSLKLFQVEIQELLKLLQYDHNDWIGICYEIGGFLALIDNEKTYIQVISKIGPEFFNKIFMSCLEQINFQKAKLLTFFFDAFLQFPEDQKIKNLTFWLQFVKPIFLSWIQLFRILCNDKYMTEDWYQMCFDGLRNFLQNENLNFYMLKRSPKFQEIISTFSEELILFLNFSLERMHIKFEDTSSFKVIKLLFRNFSGLFLEEKRDIVRNEFLNLVEKVIKLVKSKLNRVNNRKCTNLPQSIEALKVVGVIIQFFSQSSIKYSYKVNLIQTIQSFVCKQKNTFKGLQHQLHKFRLNYEKYIKFSSQKYRKSQIDLLVSISKLICELFDIESSSKSQKANQENTMSGSEQENMVENEVTKSEYNQNSVSMDSIKSLERQFIWFDIEGEKEITEY